MSFCRLLRFEFRKLLNLKIIYVMFAVSALVIFIAWKSYCRQIADFGAEYSLSAFVGSSSEYAYLPLFLALFVSLFTCQDGTEDTLKTIRARGYSSGKTYFAQLVVTYAVMLAYFILIVGFAAFMGWLGGFKKGVETGALFRSLVLRLYCLIALTAFYSFFATLVKKTGGAIAANIVLYAMGMVAFILLDLIILKVATDLFKVKSENVTFKFAEYWILNLFTSAGKFSLKGTTVVKIVSGASVYLVGGIAGGYLLSVKREVK